MLVRNAMFRRVELLALRRPDLLGELDVDELREVITDAWAKRAPKRLVAELFGSDG